MKPLHIDLGEVDPEFSGQWVDIRNPLGWTRDRRRQWQDVVNKDDDVPDVLWRWLIVAWHVIHQDTGEWLNDPTTDDLNALTPAIERAIGEAIQRPFRRPVATAGGGGSDRGVAHGDPGGPPSAA